MEDLPEAITAGWLVRQGACEDGLTQFTNYTGKRFPKGLPVVFLRSLLLQTAAIHDLRRVSRVKTTLAPEPVAAIWFTSFCHWLLFGIGGRVAYNVARDELSHLENRVYVKYATAVCDRIGV